MGIGGTPRGRFGWIGWTPICLQRTLSGLARNPGVGRYRPRLPGRSLSSGRYRSCPPEEGTLDSVVLSGRSGRKEKKKKKNRLKMLEMGLFSSGGSGTDHSRHLGFYQLSGFRKGYAFLNADSLNLLLLLQDRAIFSRWSLGTIAIRAQHGSLAPTFMLIFFRNPYTSLQHWNVGLCGQTCCSWSNASGWYQTRPPSPLDSRL